MLVDISILIYDPDQFYDFDACDASCQERHVPFRVGVVILGVGLNGERLYFIYKEETQGTVAVYNEIKPP